MPSKFLLSSNAFLLYIKLSMQICISQQAGKADFELLEKKAMEWGEPKVPSAKQVILQKYIFTAALLSFSSSEN